MICVAATPAHFYRNLIWYHLRKKLNEKNSNHSKLIRVTFCVFFCAFPYIIVTIKLVSHIPCRYGSLNLICVVFFFCDLYFWFHMRIIFAFVILHHIYTYRLWLFDLGVFSYHIRRHMSFYCLVTGTFAFIFVLFGFAKVRT